MTDVGSDQNAHKGAVEDDRPGAPDRGGAPALDSNGLPSSPVAIAEDRIGANVDDAEVANSGEAGQTSDRDREEIADLE